ncbi:MAG: T9SS type A sorting domain-containing protein [Bacteroidetes bacterium]|nr:T9SS type A sorting domain-containing protein [Bacteroidota bacterium]
MQRTVWRRGSQCFLVLLAAALAASQAFTQIVRVLPYDIKDQIQLGKASVTILPSSGSDSTKPFDGNAFTEYAQGSSDSLIVTISFDTLVSVEKTKVFFWNGGAWVVEGASSLADLDTKSGSYAMLVAPREMAFFKWDSLAFASQAVRHLRLRAYNPGIPGMYLGEWSIEGGVTYTEFVIYPSPLLLVPNATTRLTIKVRDNRGKISPNFLTEPLDYGTAHSSIALANQDGTITGVAIGNTTLTVRTDGNTLSGSAPVSVVQDFKSEKVAPMNVKVAVVYQDPVLQSSNRIHEEFHWRDPRVLATSLVRHFREATDSVVNFQITEVVEATQLFTRLRGEFMTVPQYVQLLKEPGWNTLKAASDSGLLAFDYREFVKFYHFDEKRNNGEIDEVWVFAAPYLAMYESQLMGPNAFWWNSPPIKDGTALTKLLSVMGLNYERGVDQAFHSFGHRSESAMIQAYDNALGKPWDPTSSNPTPWDLFTRIEKDMPGLSHVGNIHFPPNGTSDYNYNNPHRVISYAANWYRYPILFNQVDSVNVSTWYYTPGEPLAEGLDHLGYLRWWYGHLPRYVGVTDGVLNNWWHYVLDFEAAEALAGILSSSDPAPSPDQKPQGFRLEQNYPNPFNPSTTIEMGVGERSAVSLEVYNVLGQRIRTLAEGVFNAGTYKVMFDGAGLSSGLYFYRLSTPGWVQTRMMAMVK